MKKTIAKIMAAAMVLTSLTSVESFAKVSAIDGVTANLVHQTANLEINGVKVLEGGQGSEANSLPYLLDDAEISKLATYTGSDFKDWETTYQQEVGTVKMEVQVVKNTTAAGATAVDLTEDSSGSITPGTADSEKVYTTVTTPGAMETIAKATSAPSQIKTNKVSVDGFNDVVWARDVLRNDLVRTNIANNNGRFVIQNAWNPAYRYYAEFFAKLYAGDAVTVRSALYWNGVDTGWTIFRTFTTRNVTVADNYWNAIVKLKASNNRYTPIRVHVDAVDGSLSGWNGLYLSVANGYAGYWYDVNGRRVNVATTGNVAITSWANNRLQVQDVQADDLQLLRSDIAKGKNLMLDEAYIFDVSGLVNDNGLNTAMNWIIDFDMLGTTGFATDLGTVSLGKIQDVRSGLFKSCKEKLVHGKNLKWIRNGAFRKNKQLKKAILSDDVSMKKINEKSFYDCKKLNTVKVKVNTLKHVGKSAFGGSTDKKGLKFNLKAGSKTKFNKAVKLFKKSGVKKAKFRKI